jgi:hypothetical protein
MTGTFTTECYLMDANGSYGRVKLAIQKQSAEKVSSYETEYFSLANIHNTPAMITIAAITAIAATAKSRRIFTTSLQQQLVIFKERHLPVQPPQPQSPLISLLQPQPLPLQPPPASLVKQVPELGKFAVFDCEWHPDSKNGLKIGDVYTFCLIDSKKIVKLHVSQFPDMYAFMTAILDTMEQYTALAGYAILTDHKKKFYSDLCHIGNNCTGANNTRFSNICVRFLDVQKIFLNNVVKGFLEQTYEISWRGWDLNAVAQAYINKGKFLESGLDAEILPVDKQPDYCLRDVELCYELLQKNNFELLSILNEISQEIKLPFFETCNTNYPTKWWESKLRSIGYQRVNSDVQKWISDNMTFEEDGDGNGNGKKKGVRYLGAYVANPQVGFHKDAVSYDVSSMYPTMIDIHNISTDTVNCDCCRDDPKLVPNEVMQLINNYVMDPKNKAERQEPRPWHYWICRKNGGQLSEVMNYLRERKKHYSDSGQTLKTKAIKILTNSGYGCFGHHNFQYYDPRVAELITAYGQYTIKKLEYFVGKDNVIYGDTDSIYLASDCDELILEANRLGVQLKLERRWKILFLLPNKKQYFGITQEGKHIQKTLTGLKSSHPKYFNKVITKLIAFQESFLGEYSTAIDNVLTYVKSIFEQLSNMSLNELAFSQEVAKALYEYKSNGKERQIYSEILKDCGGDIELAKSRSQANNVYEYWKILLKDEDKKAEGKSVTIHPEMYQLNMDKYREELFNCIEPILEAYGMKEEELDQLWDELIDGGKKKDTNNSSSNNISQEQTTLA